MHDPGVSTATSGGGSLPRVPAPFEWVDRPWGATLECRLLRSFHHGWTTRSLEITGGGEGNGWRQLAAGANVNMDAVVRVRQVHGAGIVQATGPLESVREADAAISREPRVLLTIQVADCVPLLIGDPETGGVAAVHAGWRGTAAGIAMRVIDDMKRVFSRDPRNLVAAIGPSIGPCCYTVGPELREVFLKSGWPATCVDAWFQEGHERRLDLWHANRDQLLAAGMASGSIAVSDLCTACHPVWFHSYRRDRDRAGRLVAFIRALSR